MTHSGPTPALFRCDRDRRWASAKLIRESRALGERGHAAVLALFDEVIAGG